ncbi:MAG: hypothetical protein Q4A78_07295 [Peptostreptococcaceae bacterium]|nr:hypothetical protein [Peptostreptococcaceae bacterium]
MEVQVEEEVLKQQMRRRNLRMDAGNKKHFLSMVKSRTLTLSDAFWESLPKEEGLLKAMGFGIAGEQEEMICAEAAKQCVAEDVYLSEREIEALKTKYGEPAYEWMVQKLSHYKGSHGRVYESDYRAILNWVNKAYEEEKKKGSFRASSPPPSLAEEDLERRLIEKRETINRQAEQRQREQSRRKVEIENEGGIDAGYRSSQRGDHGGRI